MYIRRLLIFMFIFLLSSLTIKADEDEITFFNVGQGHCTLIRRVGYVPLLIDAGSSQNVKRVKNDRRDLNGSQKGGKVIGDVVKRIKKYWAENGAVKGILNVIVTHGDRDHVNYIPHIFQQLGVKSNFRLFLGGTRQHYQEDFSPYQHYYSSDYPGLRLEEDRNLGFLQDSGCITHLYSPTGGSEPNEWSIITRVEISRDNNPIAAILTGDAEAPARC